MASVHMLFPATLKSIKAAPLWVGTVWGLMSLVVELQFLKTETTPWAMA